MDIDLNALIRGDNSAWDRFVARYTALLYASVQRTLMKYAPNHSRDDILDIVQNVYIRLMNNRFRLLKQFDPSRSSLSTWLGVIAHSVTIDHLRKQRLRVQSLSSDLPDPAGSPPDIHEPGGGLDIPSDLLSNRQRVVLKLFFDYDMDVREISDFLGISPQTVRSTKHKGLTKLRKFFKVREDKR